MTLLAAFATLLYRYSRQRDVLVGTPIANRNRAETESLIGFFVNTLILRTRFPDQMTFRELLGQVRETALEAYAHQDLPFEKLVEELQPERTLSHSPLFQVMLDLQNAPMCDLQLQGLRLTELPFETGMAKFDLTLTVVETDAKTERSCWNTTRICSTQRPSHEWPCISSVCSKACSRKPGRASFAAATADRMTSGNKSCSTGTTLG